MKIFGRDITFPWQKRGWRRSGDGVQWLENIFSTASGQVVNEETAMRYAAVYSCINYISKQIAWIPLYLYQRIPGGVNGPKSRREATEHPLFRLLYRRPNKYQTAFDFRAMMTGHLCARGNAYAYQVWDGAGNVTDLIPLHPDRVYPYWLDMDDRSQDIRYDVSFLNGQGLTLTPDRILHLRFPSSDGLFGMSPIRQMAEVIGSGMAAEEYGAKLFQNGVRLSGFLKYPTSLSKDAKERLKTSWNEAYAGSANAHKLAVLENGLEWQAVGMTSEDAQLLQLKEFDAYRICGAFNVPPHKIGLMKQATFSNIEHQAIEAVSDCLMPIAAIWEQCLERDLLSEQDKQTLIIEFLMSGLLRGDMKSRAEALQIWRQNGVISANEWREIENLNPISAEEGNLYIVPSNMQNAKAAAATAGDAAAAQQTPTDSTPAEKTPQTDPTTEQNSKKPEPSQAFRGIFLDCFRRIVTKECKAARTALKRGALKFEDQYSDFAGFVSEVLQESLRGYVDLVGLGTDQDKLLKEISGGYVARSWASLRDGKGEALLEHWEKTRAAEETEFIFKTIEQLRG